MRYRIDALLIGRIAPLPGRVEASAIAKAPLDGPVAIGRLGLLGDEQADRRNHGGPDKAIHHYPADHYPLWRGEIGNHPLLEDFGAFGENVSTVGLAEDEACLGDRYRLGSALVEISHGRQPCWKQGDRFALKDVPGRMVITRRTGWYYRVIEPGIAQASDELVLIDRPLPDWTIVRLFGLLIAGDHRRDPPAVRALAGMAVLAEAWRSRAAGLVDPTG